MLTGLSIGLPCGLQLPDAAKPLALDADAGGGAFAGDGGASEGDLASRVMQLEQGVQMVFTEHQRLVEALQTAWQTLGREGALQIADAVIDGTPIGATSASTGKFTTLAASGLVTFTGVEDSLTAHAGGGQALALALSATKNYHRISTVATPADSVALPAATAGQAHYVRNDGANAMQVFGTTPDTINGIATGTGISLAAGTGAWFVSTTAAKWTTSFNSSAPGDIGQTTAAKGSFTTLAASGVTTLSALLDISAAGAGQISFPATQNASSGANVLDDYEEGTWTPTDGSGAALALTKTTATYEKIGRAVSAQFHITYPGTASGLQAIISGLPFNTGTNNSSPIYTSGAGGAVVCQLLNASFTPQAVAAGAITNANLSGAFVIVRGLYGV